MAKEITFEIKKKYGEIERANWNLEVNLVSWNEGSPKIDIRAWDENHEKMSKGLTLTKDETEQLREILAKI